MVWAKNNPGATQGFWRDGESRVLNTKGWFEVWSTSAEPEIKLFFSFFFSLELKATDEKGWKPHGQTDISDRFYHHAVQHSFIVFTNKNFPSRFICILKLTLGSTNYETAGIKAALLAGWTAAEVWLSTRLKRIHEARRDYKRPRGANKQWTTNTGQNQTVPKHSHAAEKQRVNGSQIALHAWRRNLRPAVNHCLISAVRTCWELSQLLGRGPNSFWFIMQSLH